MAARESYTYFEGKWHDGTPAIVTAETHGFNLGCSVFDGARFFEGITPDLDLHSARINRSAGALGLEPTHAPEDIEKIIRAGLKRFKSKEAIYIRPMYWSEAGGYMYVPPDPASTRFLVFLAEEPMIDPKGFSVTIGKWRRPSAECAPTDAKSGCLYPMGGKIIMEAKARGFQNALVLDLLGNVAETATSNVFMVKDGVVLTPIPNGSFLNGITRQRVIVIAARGGPGGRRALDPAGGVFRGRRNLRDRQSLEGDADHPHRGTPPPGGPGRQAGAGAVLGLGAWAGVSLVGQTRLRKASLVARASDISCCVTRFGRTRRGRIGNSRATKTCDL